MANQAANTTTEAKEAKEAKEARHLAAERDIKLMKYDRANGKAQGNPDIKQFFFLADGNPIKVAVQVVKDGGENNLHFHTNTDIVYFVLKGRVRFHGPDKKVYGEFGPHEGLVLPADSRYWFEKASTEDLELFQIFSNRDLANPEKAQRVNAEPAKDWMAGQKELQVYEES